MNDLLDTNILLIYTQSSSLADRLEGDLSLFTFPNNLFTSVVAIGEMESLIMQREYGQQKRTAFRKLLEKVAILDINILEVILRYAEIDAYSQGKHPNRTSSLSARNMGKNDLWIAATSSYYNLELVTTDKDFDHLNRTYLNLNYVDIRKYKK